MGKCGRNEVGGSTLGAWDDLGGLDVFVDGLVEALEALVTLLQHSGGAGGHVEPHGFRHLRARL